MSLIRTLSLIAVAALTAQSAEPTSFTLAIARLDGRLVPFATFDNGEWDKPWPEADQASKSPLVIDAIPSIWLKRGERVPTSWTVWPSSGTRSVRTRVRGVEAVNAHCQRQVALATDLAPIKGDDHSKRGIAVDTDLVIGGVEEVPASDAQRRAAERSILASFDRLELQESLRSGVSLMVESPAPSVRIVVLYRERGQVRSPMYFVAEKAYKNGRPQAGTGCPDRTVLTGWLLPDRTGQLSLKDHDIFFTDCDGKGIRTAQALAALHVSDRSFWILQEHGYEDETFVVVEITADGVHRQREAAGGGC
ncbi:MAG TPA: hypothetical protein VFS23_13480 [Vicinamibacterales bacterium]|nr:hypothetical protein [Vicinamibacterales bacterium]